MKTKRDPRELKAMAYRLADEIETRAAPKIAAGMSRIAAINAAMSEMVKS